ncbi:MFS transporter [Afipia massiliensis]|uniref:MFS transporter n=1 Tax=Afipia massiliensis TaxID=211460 RepID=A0A4U6BSS0_9BRAD|nr:MFS transporter [Afipia massiliensis]TKT72665.1 MFS transporter [Afipia massiliensis]
MAARTSHAGWKVVIGSGIGISFGSLVFMGAGFALLASAWARQFGWTQPELAKAATIFLLIQTAMYPVCGWMLDRWGSRKVATGSIALFAISLILLSQIGNSLTQMYLAFGLVSLVSAGTNVVSYARAIAFWFDRRRGLALGLAASAQAVGSFFIPILAQKIIAQSGWSAALLSLAAVELLICLPLVALLVKDNPDGAQSAETAPGAKREAPGMDVRDIVRTATFWKLAVCFAIMGLSLYAIAANIAFILTETAGMPLADVAMIQAVSGLSVLLGRIGFGYLLDKLQAPVVGILTVTLAAACFGLYATATAPALIFVAAATGGIAVGGETDLMPYLASRYFGTRAVSKTFGWFLFAFFIGAAIGPVAFAQLSAAHGGAVVPLFLLAALQLIPAALFLSLGRYPEAATEADVTSAKSARRAM